MNLIIFLLLQTSAPTTAAESPAVVGNAIWQNIVQLFRVISGALPYLAAAAVVFIAFRLASRLADRAVKAIVLRMRLDAHLATLLGGFASILVTVIGIIAAVLILFPQFNPLDVMAALGALSIALGFIFKDTSENFISGVMILWRKPFVIGDQIKVGLHEGTVEGFTFRSTLIKTYLGELLFVPHSHIFANEILVKTAYEQRGVKFNVGIGYLDDIEQGRETIRRVLSQTEGVSADPAPMVYVSELGESSVNFTLYFYTESKQSNVLKVSDQVTTGIKYALDKEGIDMPYPHTVVLFQDPQEIRQNDALARRFVRPDAAGSPSADVMRDGRSAEK